MEEVIEDQEALFHSYQYALYYVQSPSTQSHANSTIELHNNNELSASRFTLSRYSSSHGSNNSLILHGKKIDNGSEKCTSLNVHDLVKDVHNYDYDGDDEYYERRGWWKKYFTYDFTSSSCNWISIQISWRLLISLCVALLVFYLATKPPSPKIALKIATMPQFLLAEGADANGIPTKILTFNCTMDLIIDNNSKFFGLHISPPSVDVSFIHFTFATSRGPKLYAKSYNSALFKLYVGTRSRSMYGAGRSMQDMLESGQGLPLAIRVSFKSSFRVVWDLIKPTNHYQAKCLLFLNSTYDNKHKTQSFNSTCSITS